MTRILIIDDNPTSVVFVRQMLEFEGFEIMQAEDGDLVISDMRMPGMDGPGVLHALRADPRTAELPVVLISGVAETEMAQKCLEYSAVSYLVKPFPVGDLLTLIHLALA
jgi:CheY-like chemotaxis protein